MTWIYGFISSVEWVGGTRNAEMALKILELPLIAIQRVAEI